MSPVRRALLHPGTWLGFVGVSLVVAGGYALPGVPGNFTSIGLIHHWWTAMRGLGRHLQLVGLICLSIGFVVLRPRRGRDVAAIWPVFGLWALPLLGSLPLLSPDLYSYLDYSWILHQGQDPYRTGLGTVAGPYSNVADPIWKGAIAVYPPLDLRLYYLVAAASGWHVVPSVLLGRLPALLGAVLAGLLIPDIARRGGIDPDRARWMCLLNPLTVVIGVGGAHNDMLMVGLMILAIWVAFRRRGWILCAVVAGLACGIKQPGIVAALTGAMIATANAAWPRRLAYAAGSLAIAVATFVVTSLAAGLGFGWIRGLAIPGSVASTAPQYALATIILIATRSHVYAALKIIGYVLMAIGIGYVVATKWKQPVTATAAIVAIYALLSPNLHAWYLLPVFVLLAATRVTRPTRAALAGLTLYLLAGALLTITYGLDTVFVSFFVADLALVLAWLWLNRSRIDDAMALPEEETQAGLPAGVVARGDDRGAEHDPATGELTQEPA